MSKYRMVEAKIWVYEGPPEEGKTPVKRICRFHGFSMDFLELEAGLAPYPVAIVEAPDGSIHTSSADTVRFATGLMDDESPLVTGPKAHGSTDEPDVEAPADDKLPCVTITCDGYTTRIYVEEGDTEESINARINEEAKVLMEGCSGSMVPFDDDQYEPPVRRPGYCSDCAYHRGLISDMPCFVCKYGDGEDDGEDRWVANPVSGVEDE